MSRSGLEAASRAAPILQRQSPQVERSVEETVLGKVWRVKEGLGGVRGVR